METFLKLLNILRLIFLNIFAIHNSILLPASFYKRYWEEQSTAGSGHLFFSASDWYFLFGARNKIILSEDVNRRTFKLYYDWHSFFKLAPKDFDSTIKVIAII